MKQIILAGYGNMGSALAKAWQARMPDTSLISIDPRANASHPSLDDVPADIKPDIVVIAVKPQSIDEVLPLYAKRFGLAPLYLSIAAGKPLSYYEKHLGNKARVIRAMPNTPVQVGKGASVMIGNANATDADRQAAQQLFVAVGTVNWLDNETQMHAATALSGSGPAYVFLFLDALIQSATALGLPEETARALAVQTVRGAAELAALRHESLELLRREVTSPGGTTEAAMAELLRDSRFLQLINDALNAAARRCESL